jgi:hypothetical protein
MPTLNGFSIEIDKMEGSESTRFVALISYEDGNQELRFESDFDTLVDLRRDAISGMTGMTGVTIYTRVIE